MIRLFTLASSPFLNSELTTSQIMRNVCLALIPGIAAQWYFFGWGNLIQILIAIVVAYGSEALVLKLRGRRLAPTLLDNSALLTAILLGIALPGYAPWWVVTIGTLFAIIVAKHLYGGLGQNLFNPAMVGFVVLIVAFPVQMTNWSAPLPIAMHKPDLQQSLNLILSGTTQQVRDLASGIDGITMATPLDHIKTGLKQGTPLQKLLKSALFEHNMALGWFAVNLAFVIGGLFLLIRKLISWRLSVSFLITLFVCSFTAHLIDPKQFAAPMLTLFSGATMLGAFFIITDPVTAATSERGKLIYGALIGLLLFLVRAWGNYPDAVAFSVLLGNLCAPLIDQLTRPRTYGHKVEKVRSNRAMMAFRAARREDEQL